MFLEERRGGRERRRRSWVRGKGESGILYVYMGKYLILLSKLDVCRVYVDVFLLVVYFIVKFLYTCIKRN